MQLCRWSGTDALPSTQPTGHCIGGVAPRLSVGGSRTNTTGGENVFPLRWFFQNFYSPRHRKVLMTCRRERVGLLLVENAPITTKIGRFPQRKPLFTSGNILLLRCDTYYRQAYLTVESISCIPAGKVGIRLTFGQGRAKSPQKRKEKPAAPSSRRFFPNVGNFFRKASLFA